MATKGSELDPAPLAAEPMIFGWRVACDRPLPLLPPWAGWDASDPISVTFGPVDSPPGAPLIQAGGTEIHRDGLIVIRHPDGPRLSIDQGRAIRIEAGHLNDAELHTWLFNVAAPVLCHQRGRPPLHGAVIGVGGRAVVLAGAGGQGKSTTLWAMLGRGHELLSDDLAVIDLETLTARPAFPAVKLWSGSAPDARDDSGLRSLRGKDKFFHPRPDRFRATPAPLALVIGLTRDPLATRPTAKTIAPPRAAASLHRHVWGRGFARALDRDRAAFTLATTIAGAVPHVALRRPDDLTALDGLCALIEDLVANAGTRSP